MTSFLPWIDADDELPDSSAGMPADTTIRAEDSPTATALADIIAGGEWPSAPSLFSDEQVSTELGAILADLRNEALAPGDQVRHVVTGAVVDDHDANSTLRLPALVPPAESYAALSVESYSSRASSLVEKVGLAIGAQTNLALFCAGPGSTGFPPHYDVFHSVLVQLEGSKTWSVYPGPVELPMLEHEWPSVQHLYPEGALRAAETDRIDIELAAGDILWIPQGWIHEGRSSLSGSVHATVGVRTARILDLLTAVIASAGGLPWARAELPPRKSWGDATAASSVDHAIVHLTRTISQIPRARLDNGASHWLNSFVRERFEMN